MKRYFLKKLLCAGRDNCCPIIAEIKPSTPDTGDLLRGRNPLDLALTYQSCGAACISVVTGKWFGGTLSLLQQIAEAVDLPILRKDFIVSKAELERSKAYGASAVLLTRKLLREKQLLELCHYALDLYLTPFVEVADQDELRGLALPTGSILTINNRDISVKETDDGTFHKSLSLLQAAKKIKASALVSASSIEDWSQANHLIEAGYDGLLIGSSLLRAKDLVSEWQAYQEIFGIPQAA